MKTIILILFHLLLISQLATAGQFTWTGNNGTTYSDPDNWDGPGGAPGPNDTIIIDNLPNIPILDSNFTVYYIQMLASSTLDLDVFVLIVEGYADMQGGQIINGELIIRGESAVFNGTEFTCKISVHANYIDLLYGTFYDTCYFELLGNTNCSSFGLCTFYEIVSIVNSSSGEWHLGPNQFDADLTLIVASDGPLYMSENGETYYNGNLYLNNAGDAPIIFGYEGGASYLADEKTIAVGDSGYVDNDLYLTQFTQIGEYSQNLELTGNSNFFIQACVFEGIVNFVAGNLLCSGSVFNNEVDFNKTGPDPNFWSGSNYFYGLTSITNSSPLGSDNVLNLASSDGNIFYSDVEFNSTDNSIQVSYSGNTDFYGDIFTNSDRIGFGGTVYFKGTQIQTISGNTALMFANLTILKSENKIVADTTIVIYGLLTFNKGNLQTNSEHLLIMNAGSSVTGASDSSFVDGPVKKIGNTSFEFPIGKGEDFRPLMISQPDSAHFQYQSEYFNTEQNFSNNLDTLLDAISNCNYWSLEQLVGIDSLGLTFSWSNENCIPFDTSISNIARLDNSIWTNIGHGLVDGTPFEGSVTISDVSDFGYFTYATDEGEIMSNRGIIKNNGQILYTNQSTADSVIYYCENGYVSYYIYENKISYVFGFHDFVSDEDSLYRMDLIFLNSSDSVSIESGSAISFRNYYLAHTNNGLDSVPVLDSVFYSDLYDGVTLGLTLGAELKFEFVVDTGVSTETIEMQFVGSDSIKVMQDGNIFVFVAGRKINFFKPAGKQVIGGVTSKVLFNPHVEDNILTLESVSYSSSYPLVLSVGPRPSRGHRVNKKWSTYIEGSSFLDGAEDVWIDDENNIYLAGTCNNADLPVLWGQYTVHDALADAFLFKFNQNRGIVWGTYFGGDSDDYGMQVVVNSEGYVYLTGQTFSSNLPVCTACTADILLKEDTPFGSWDLFIAKFGADGSSDHNSILFPDVFRTYFGAEGEDEVRAMVIDSEDNIYLAGVINDNGGTGSYDNFPFISLSGAYNQDFGEEADENDAFLIKIDNLNDVVWSTAIGGNSTTTKETISSLAVDEYDNLYATGFTSADGITPIPEGPLTTYPGDFPLVDPDDVSTLEYAEDYHGGNFDAFIMKFNTDGAIVWSTLFGGSGTENENLIHTPFLSPASFPGHMNSGVAVGADGKIYITGSTSSNTDFEIHPLTGTNKYNQPNFNNPPTGGCPGTPGTTDAYIAMFSPSYELLWSTYYGGCGDEAGVAIASDKLDNHIYIAGYTTSSDFPTLAISGGYSQSYKAPSDAFVLSFLNTNYDFATLFGGTGGPNEVAKSIVTDVGGTEIVFCGTSDDYNGFGTSDFPYRDLPGPNDYFWSTELLTGDPNQKAYVTNLRFYCNPCWRTTMENNHIQDQSIKNTIDIVISPNPASSFVTFDHADDYDIKYISILDLSGKIVIDKSISTNKIVNISGIEPGIYLIRFQDNSGIELTKKLIIQ